MGEKGKSEEREKTYTKSTGFSAFGKGSHAASVDVKDGKIVRIRPLHFDSKYTIEEIQPWKIEARGKVLEPYMKSLITPFGAGFKKRIYSPNRILYPLKRVDWDPNGERNPENRGKSKYVRISWDEAIDLIVSEIKRIIKKYGPEGILGQVDGHGETKVVHATHGCAVRLLELLGGYTLQVRNPDSWEGWYWGAKHVWGMEPIGLMSPHQTNLFPDISKHTDLLLFWGCDPETTPWGFAGGQMASRIAYWFTELGIKCIYICPDLNYGAAVHAETTLAVTGDATLSGGATALTFSAASSSIVVPDNSATALVLGSTDLLNLITIDTSDGSETVTINGDLTVTGSAPAGDHPAVSNLQRREIILRGHRAYEVRLVTCKLTPMGL